MTENDKHLSRYLDEVERLEGLIDERNEAEEYHKRKGLGQTDIERMRRRAAAQAQIVTALSTAFPRLPKRPALDCGCLSTSTAELLTTHPCPQLEELHKSDRPCNCCEGCALRCAEDI